MYPTDRIITLEMAEHSYLCTMCFFDGQLSKVYGKKWIINTILWLQGLNWAWTNDQKRWFCPLFISRVCQRFWYFCHLPHILCIEIRWWWSKIKNRSGQFLEKRNPSLKSWPWGAYSKPQPKTASEIMAKPKRNWLFFHFIGSAWYISADLCAYLR